MKYLYALMDDQTRFWIAQEVADTKFTADLRPLFQLGKQIAEKSPKTLITDGAPNFHEAYLKEFYTKRLETRTEHIQEIHVWKSSQQQDGKNERRNKGQRALYANAREDGYTDSFRYANLPQLCSTTPSIER